MSKSNIELDIILKVKLTSRYSQNKRKTPPKMIPIIGYLTKIGFYALAAKLVVSGGMSVWMCSNVENITSLTNFTTETDNLKFSMDHITTRISEAAEITGYECGERCSDIVEIARHYKGDISNKLRIDCENPNSNLLAIGMSSATCDYISSPEGVSGIIDSISYGALEYVPGEKSTNKNGYLKELSTDLEAINPKSSTDTKFTELKVHKVSIGELQLEVPKVTELSEGFNLLKSFISDKYNTIVKTTKNSRRHVGWLVQGKTKTLEIITDLINRFINNLKMFLQRDFTHWKSALQKKYEDYELCINYVHQTINTCLSLLPLSAAL